MNNVVLKILSRLLMPALLLMATHLSLPRISELNPSTQDLIRFFSYLLILLGMALSFKFNRSRIFYFLLLLGIAVGAHDYFIRGGREGHHRWGVLQALYYLLPINAVIFCFLRERGIHTFQGGVRFSFILVQAVLAAWLIGKRQEWLVDLAAYRIVQTPWIPSLSMPQPALLLLLAGFILILAAVNFKRSPIETGFFGALVAIAIALLLVTTWNAFPLFISTAALILILSIIQDSHSMAYRDELTSLNARRALNESLRGLGRRYTIAMLDVDHFKKFNDTYGHDVGDQVLKMVGRQMKEITGGGRPFRYGGEEFTIVFPKKGVEKTVPHLEALRESIAAYEMKLRSKDRPKRSRDGKRQRQKRGEGKTVSVTISIGVAERSGEARTPEAVIKAADKALYQAKRKGRNCLTMQRTGNA